MSDESILKEFNKVHELIIAIQRLR